MDLLNILVCSPREEDETCALRSAKMTVREKNCNYMETNIYVTKKGNCEHDLYNWKHEWL